MGDQSIAANPLEQFVLLAKNAKGAAAVELIKQALEAPAVFVFGELLDMANIQVVMVVGVALLTPVILLPSQDLTNGPHAAYLTILNMFAFGTYKDLTSCSDPIPDLSPLMRRKLRLLTVVNLAEQSKLLSYSLLMQELHIDNVRELEDLVIEGISAGVVQGKLDQKSSHFEVDYVIGRDIR